MYSCTYSRFVMEEMKNVLTETNEMNFLENMEFSTIFEFA
jgi:hypothetical protein